MEQQAKRSPLTENICVLEILNPTPYQESENTVSAEVLEFWSKTTYVLPFKYEQQIAKAFAVLLTKTADPDKVGALCIEEKVDGKGLIVSIAANTGNVVERKVAMQKVACVMMEIASAAPFDRNSSYYQTLAERLEDELIAACQLRLLYRLRSVHALSSRKTGRPSVIPRLREALLYLQDAYSVTSSDTIWSHVQRANTSFTDLENMAQSDAQSAPGRLILKDILASITSLLTSTDICNVLKKLPPRDGRWGGQAATGIIESLRKISQYSAAVQLLFRAARRFEICRSIKVTSVDGAPFAGISDGRQPQSCNAGLLTRSYSSRSERSTALHDAVATRLHQRVQPMVQPMVFDYLNNAIQEPRRIHAEIQLLMHYSHYQQRVKLPRVIYSSKHACYLCNLFVRIDGRFFIPSTHGKVYSKWRLPTCREIRLDNDTERSLDLILERFNREIEDEIQKQAAREPCKGKDPKESIVFSHSDYSASVSTVVEHPGPRQRVDSVHYDLQEPPFDGLHDMELDDAGQDQKDESSPVLVTPPACSSSVSLLELPSVVQASVHEPSHKSKNSNEQSSPSAFQVTHERNTSTTILNSEVSDLENGATTIIRLSQGAPPAAFEVVADTSVRFHTPRIHLEVTFEDAERMSKGNKDMAQRTCDRASDVITLLVQWKSDGYSDDFTDGHTIDLNDARFEHPIPEGILFTDTGLILKKKSHLVSIRAVPVISNGAT